MGSQEDGEGGEEVASVAVGKVGRALHKIRWGHPPLGQYRATADTARPTGRFADLFFAHDGRPVDKWHGYFEVYDRAFGLFAGRPVRMLEIGVQHGGSLELWQKFLGPDATVFGVDVDPRCAERCEGLNVRIGSQAHPDFLRSVVDEMDGLDLVLDDGSHVAKDQRASFDTLWPLLADGGVYVVEDTASAYWWRYGGGWRRPGSFVQVAKGMVDGMHRWYYRWPLGRRDRLARTEVGAISFFDSVVVIEKRLHGPPVREQVGVKQR